MKHGLCVENFAGLIGGQQVQDADFIPTDMAADRWIEPQVTTRMNAEVPE